MRQAFQDRDALYLVMDLMPGGDLRYHICRKHQFNEQEIRYFAACIFIGLEFMHRQKIIHRDIKPENLVFDSKGFFSFIQVIFILQTWELPSNIVRKTIWTPVGLQDIWLLKLWQSKIIVMRLIIMLWELSCLSSWWGEDPMWEETEDRSRSRSWPNKQSSKKVKFQKVGAFRQQILWTN